MRDLHDVCFLFVERNLELLADLPDAVEACAEILLAVVYKVAVVHIPPVSADPQDLLHVVIETIRGCQRQRLTYLASEANANIAKHPHEVHRESQDLPVREFLPEDLFNQPVRYPVEEFAEIEKKDISFRPVFPVMLPEMPAESPY